MQVQNVGRLSLGQWIAIRKGWDARHGGEKAPAPTEDEFDLAVMRARGAA